METAPAIASLWRTYGEHAALLFAHGPEPIIDIDDGHFFVASGARHVDLNQAALYGSDGVEDAATIARHAAAAPDVPVLLARTSAAATDPSGPIGDAGFVALPTREHLFWMRGVPAAVAQTAFDVRRMVSDADIAAMQAMFEDVHGYERSLTDAIHGSAVRADDRVTGWIARDGDEPVSVAFATALDGSVGLWDVMTPVRHRRRGAGRAVVIAALRGAASLARSPVRQTIFWSSPAGRPLYEAIGFRIADTVEAWVRGASDEDLAAVGAG